MYFQNFPFTYYSLDDAKTVQLVTDITNRAVISDELKNNFSLYDEYDIKDGETPELVADKFYNNPELHWIVLNYNDIIDPRFDWPLDTVNLSRYVSGKYTNSTAVHHYEDVDGNYINGNILLQSNNQFGSFQPGDVVINNTNSGTGVITTKDSNSFILVTTVSSGGFIAGDQIKNSLNVNAVANITVTTSYTGTPVSNFVYEDEVNESKRRIKILKAEYVDGVVSDFKKKLGE
jgi:hypothetical protein